MSRNYNRLAIIGGFLAGFLVTVGAFFVYLSFHEYRPTDYFSSAGESESGTQSEDLQDIDILFESIIEEIEKESHNSARDDERYYQRLDLICRSYPILCDTVTLTGPFSLEDSFFYKAITVFIVARMDDYHKDSSLENVLKSVRITDDGGRRGFANRHEMTINTAQIESYGEFLEIVVHELGHIVDLGLIQGTSRTYHKEFTEFGRRVFGVDDPSLYFYELSWSSEQVRKSSVDRYDFCSGYGQTNPFEDFAECFNLYKNHNALFRSLAEDNTILRQKYNIIAGFFDGKYLYDNQGDLRLLSGSRPFFVFDTTKIREM